MGNKIELIFWQWKKRLRGLEKNMVGEPSNNKKTRGGKRDSKQQQQEKRVNVEASNEKIMKKKKI